MYVLHHTFNEITYINVYVSIIHEKIYKTITNIN